MTWRERDRGTGRLAYDYAIVGVQKGGTSTLSWGLRQHPLVAEPPRKEAHFFSNEDYDWGNPDYQRDYSVVPQAPHQRSVGDSTPAYLFWPQALTRMHQYSADMRLIAIFRDPLERLFSNWIKVRDREMPWIDWPRFIKSFVDPVLPEAVPPGVRPVRYRRLAGVARGLYGQQVQRGLSIYPRDQWLFLELRSMLSDFGGTLDAAAHHVGLPPFEAHPPLTNRNPAAVDVSGTAPTGRQLASLAEFYEADLGLFEQLTGIDTTAWSTRRIISGDLDPEELAAGFAAKMRVEG